MADYRGAPPAYTEAVGGAYTKPSDQGYPPTSQGYPPTSQGYPPTSQGYPPTSQGYPQGYSQAYGHQAVSTSNVVLVTQQPTHTVVVGGCRLCGGHMSESFTALGVLLAICFFPLGVLCCFLLMEKRCDNCGASF